MEISVIIPVINEEKNLLKIIPSLKKDPSIEYIFVDGGSKDNTTKVIKNEGFLVINSPILRRSYQMNLGAKLAQGKILLFLHGDTILPNNYQQIVIETTEKKDFILGAFNLTIDSKKSVFRFLETLIKARSKYLSLPYGDQAIFLHKKTFQKINGYQDMAIMEDFELVKRVKKLGKIYIASSSVITSSRRWDKLGVFKTTVINQLVILGYYCRINPQKLAEFYRQIKGKL